MIGSRSFRMLSTLLLALTFVAPAAAQAYKEAFNAGNVAAGAKNYAEALRMFTEAADGAEVEGDSEVVGKSNRVIGQIEYIFGVAKMRGEDYDGALAHFDNGITRLPTYAKNFLGRALAYKKLDRIDDAMAAFQEAMEVGTANADRPTARKAENAIREHFVFLASSALSRNANGARASDADEALAALAKLEEYVSPDADVLYYTAVAYRAQGKNVEAAQKAEEALALHRGSQTDKAKIYFIMGEALMSSGDNPSAKAALEKAAVGTYRLSAEHLLGVLAGTN
jgi:tetratricopeptide (TPR) repeat protein